MIFENYIKDVDKQQFIDKAKKISSSLGIKPEWLFGVMYSESRINPQAVNASTNATGLIQFMPATANGLGTSVYELKNMNSLQQLDYVYKYFKPKSGELKSFFDLYLYTFFPIAIGKPDSWVLHSENLSAGSIATRNPLFDTNKDNQITVGEFRNKMRDILPAEVLSLEKSLGIALLTIGFASGIGYFISRKIKGLRN